MYPQQDLIRIALHKAALRHSIALNRERIVEATSRVSKPVAFADRALAFWRDLSPIVRISAVPLGVVATRALFPRLRILRTVVRWSPLVIAAMRALKVREKGGAPDEAASMGKSESVAPGMS
jgi:hypothetical protein